MVVMGYGGEMTQARTSMGASSPKTAATTVSGAASESERHAREQEAWFRALFDTIPLSAVIVDPETFRFLQFNDIAAQTLGYTREEFARLTVYDIDPAYAPEREQQIVEQLRSGETVVFETRHRTKSGVLRDVVVRIRFVTMNGKPVSNAIWEDVTDKKAAEAALIKSERRASEQEKLFRTLFETTPLSTALIDLETMSFLQFNDSAAKNLGYTRDEFATLTVFDVDAMLTPEGIRQGAIELERASDTAVLETKHRTKSGELRDVVVYGRHMTLDGRRVSNCVWEDVTEKKTAERALLGSERHALEQKAWFRTLFDLFRNLYETTPLSAALIDLETMGFVLFNDAAARNLGYTHEEFAKLTVFDIDAVFTPEELRQLINDPHRMQDTSVVETKHRTKSGALRDVIVRNHLMTVDGRRVTNCVWEDVTEKKAAEAALIESERRAKQAKQEWERTFNTVPDLVAILDNGYRILRANQAMAQRLGTTPEACVGMSCFCAVHDRTKPPTGCPYALTLNDQKEHVGEVHEERLGGSFLVSTTPLFDEQGQMTGVVHVARDITERKQAEQALLRSEKLASVGRMAATVAHEVNNPLAAIINYVYLVRTAPDLRPELKQNLETVERELHRLAHITRRTLGFYRESTKPSAVDLVSLVDEVAELYDPKHLPRSVHLQIEHKGQGDPVIAIAGELRQVIANLIANAIDASKPGTSIRVRTSRVATNGTTCMRVSVADSGIGIRTGDRRRIFEPFFTTRKAVGTGLGLWVSGEIIHKHGGRIRFRSAEGRGSVFCIFLPTLSGAKAATCAPGA